MKKRLVGFFLAILILAGILPMSATHAATLSAAPNMNINYGETSEVAAGTIRYVSQLTASPNFRTSYWGEYVEAAGHECFTASISMALSGIGVNATPITLARYWTEQGHTGGSPFPTVQWDVEPFGAAYLNRSFEKAMQAYLNEPGRFSPPIIHLNTYSERGHYVLVAGKVSGTEYQIVDPASDSVWNAKIQNNEITYPRKGEQRTEQLEPVTQYQRTGRVTFTAPAPTVSAPAPTPAPTPAVIEKSSNHQDGTSCVSFKYVDVPAENNWAHEGIDYCMKRGLMQGTDDTHFSPNVRMTRAMMVTVLYRAAGSPSVEGMPQPFSDLSGAWYRDAVTWAYHLGITGGVSADRFAPGDLVTREQLVAMLYRYRQLTHATPAMINALDAFRDSGSVSSWAAEPMRWAVTSGVLTGVSATELCPGGTANRAQMATILMRFQNL